MRIRTVLVAAATTLTALVGLGGNDPAGAAAPKGDISSNVSFIANIPTMATAISINFLSDDVMVVSTILGIYTYDISQPSSPTLLGALPQYIWENEDVDVDPVRKLIFLSRDPRGFTSPATTAFPYGMVQVIDASNPSQLKELSQVLLPSGHTTTCVDSCRYLRTAGPAKGLTQPADWTGGRPVFATDLRDPKKPVVCPEPIDTHRNDGKTDYTHDVQVDWRGIAWVSGSGGIRGYWVTGRHRDATDGKWKVATGCSPVPYGGGGTELGEFSRRNGLMHNAWHSPTLAVDGRKGDVLLATEEVTGSDCAGSGKFATYDLQNTYKGAGFRNIAQTKFRMKQLSTWTPEKAPAAAGCDSAHYFQDRGDGLLSMAWYSQGTRFLDVRDPRHIKQVAYYRPSNANTWAAYWHKGYVYVADFQRGVDVIQLTGKAAKSLAPTTSASGAPTPGISLATVTAPVRSAASLIAPGTAADPTFGWICRVPAAVPTLSAASTRS